MRLLNLASLMVVFLLAACEQVGLVEDDSGDSSGDGETSIPTEALIVTGTLANGESDVDDGIIQSQTVAVMRSDGAQVGEATSDDAGEFSVTMAEGALVIDSEYSLVGESAASEKATSKDFSYHLIAKASDNATGKALGVRRKLDFGSSEYSSSTGTLSTGETEMKEISAITGSIAFDDDTVSVDGADVFIPGQPFFVRTGDSGEFNLFFVPSGTYDIRMTKGIFIKDVSVTVVPGKTTNVGELAIGVSDRNPLPLSEVIIGTWSSTCYYKDAGSTTPENPKTGQITINDLDDVEHDSGDTCLIRSMGAGDDFSTFTEFLVTGDGAIVGKHGSSYYYYIVSDYTNDRINLLVNESSGIGTGTIFEVLERVD